MISKGVKEYIDQQIQIIDNKLDRIYQDRDNRFEHMIRAKFDELIRFQNDRKLEYYESSERMESNLNREVDSMITQIRLIEQKVTENKSQRKFQQLSIAEIGRSIREKNSKMEQTIQKLMTNQFRNLIQQNLVRMHAQMNEIMRRQENQAIEFQKFGEKVSVLESLHFQENDLKKQSSSYQDQIRSLKDEVKKQSLSFQGQLHSLKDQLKKQSSSAEEQSRRQNDELKKQSLSLNSLKGQFKEQSLSLNSLKGQFKEQSLSLKSLKDQVKEQSLSFQSQMGELKKQLKVPSTTILSQKIEKSQIELSKKIQENYTEIKRQLKTFGRKQSQLQEISAKNARILEELPKKIAVHQTNVQSVQSQGDIYKAQFLKLQSDNQLIPSKLNHNNSCNKQIQKILLQQKRQESCSQIESLTNLIQESPNKLKQARKLIDFSQKKLENSTEDIENEKIFKNDKLPGNSIQEYENSSKIPKKVQLKTQVLLERNNSETL